ncbi:hypothetical protein HanIR_Chr01g0013421 [Helianthus annuus]|nr:hypothetical protein HanIR_Chr01g0013421 [Helianthus annuus]
MPPPPSSPCVLHLCTTITTTVTTTPTTTNTGYQLHHRHLPIRHPPSPLSPTPLCNHHLNLQPPTTINHNYLRPRTVIHHNHSIV